MERAVTNMQRQNGICHLTISVVTHNRFIKLQIPFDYKAMSSEDSIYVIFAVVGSCISSVYTRTSVFLLALEEYFYFEKFLKKMRVAFT